MPSSAQGRAGEAPAGYEEDSKPLAYRGKCPKQADEVDKAIAAVRKRITP
jgi:hypothetical protein